MKKGREGWWGRWASLVGAAWGWLQAGIQPSLGCIPFQGGQGISDGEIKMLKNTYLGR